MGLIPNSIVCIVGPTASGKSDLAQQVALRINGEVVSADSMQVYKGMDIGTGKVPVEDRIVPHHGLDLVSPGEPYSAALFQSYARKTFCDISSRGCTSILAGGTGFYVRAAIDDYDFPKGEQVDNPLREELMEYLNARGPMELWERLKELDPQSADLIHPNNSKRVIRALEMRAQGKSYADQLRSLSSIGQHIPAIMIGLSVDPDLLRTRIDSRADKMREAGLVDEVRGLMESGFEEAITAPQAIGYKEIVEALHGRCSLDDAFDRIKQATRRYAKRQRTWFRKDERIKWIDADSGEIDHMVEQALSIIEQGADEDRKRDSDED